MTRILALGVLLLGSITFAKAPVPEEPDLTDAVYVELGLPIPTKDNWTLPVDYKPDAVTVKEIEKDPKKYPVRSAVLEAVKALKESRELVPLVTVVHKEDLEKDKGNKRLIALQERPAIAILTLEEALAALDQAVAKRKNELSKRWQAHLDFVRAEVQFRLVVIHEYNLKLGHVRMQNLPDLDPEKRETGWKLVPAEKIQSKRDVRDLAKAAKEGYLQVMEKYPRTPWSKLAEPARDAPMGLQWETVANAIDQ